MMYFMILIFGHVLVFTTWILENFIFLKIFEKSFFIQITSSIYIKEYCLHWKDIYDNKKYKLKQFFHEWAKRMSEKLF